jgi:hypothetical protein
VKRLPIIAPLACAVVLLLNSIAFAGPETIIKQRAKDLRDQNNAQQGVPPRGPVPAQPSVVPAAPAPPSLSPSLVRVQTQLASLNAGSPATPDQSQKMTDDLLAAAGQAKLPRPLVSKLVEDLTAAFAEKPLPASSRTRLVQELDAVLNPAKYPQAKLEGILKDIQTMFQNNGLSLTQAVGIVNDVKAISKEIQKG